MSILFKVGNVSRLKHSTFIKPAVIHFPKNQRNLSCFNLNDYALRFIKLTSSESFIRMRYLLNPSSTRNFSSFVPTEGSNGSFGANEPTHMTVLTQSMVHAYEQNDICEGECRSIFKFTSSIHLLRAYCIFHLCSYHFLVKNATSFISFLQAILPKFLFHTLMKKSFYEHFVAGENLSDLLKATQKLDLLNTKLFLAVPAEELPLNPSERESKLSENVAAALECLQISSQCSCDPVISAKLTAFFPFHILEKMAKKGNAVVPEDISSHILNAEQNFSFFNPEDTQVYHKSIGSLKAVIQILNLRIFMDYTATISLPMIFLWMRDRAEELKVRVLFDAEYTSINPAIVAIVKAFMLHHNHHFPLLGVTYQCYLKNSYNSLLEDLDFTSRNQIYHSFKLVRGAYMQKEIVFSRQNNIPSPIFDSYEQTGENYDNVSLHVISQLLLPSSKISVMFASHNKSSLLSILNKMKNTKINPGEKFVSFSQLYGMCDYLTFPLAENKFTTYKNVPYGSLEDTLLYLIRRASENNSVFQRLVTEKRYIACEIKRRIKHFLKLDHLIK